MIYLAYQNRIVCQDGSRIVAEPMPDGHFAVCMKTPNFKGEFTFLISIESDMQSAHDIINNIVMRLSKDGHTIIRT